VAIDSLPQRTCTGSARAIDRQYEEVYLRAYDTVSEARASLVRYVAFYNARRPHSSIEDSTPDEEYLGVQATESGSVIETGFPTA
jgi:putative transposase